MEIPGPAFRSGGTISPCRAVKIDVSADRQVVQATASSKCIGIAQEGQKGAPGLPGSDSAIAALAGDQLQVIGPGRVALAELGSAVTSGDDLEADGNGRLVPATTTGVHNIVARALEAGAATGMRINVFVMPHQITI